MFIAVFWQKKRRRNFYGVFVVWSRFPTLTGHTAISTNKKHLKNVGPIRHSEPRAARRITIHQASLLSRRTPPAHRYPRRRRRRRQRVTEGTAMAPWNGPNEEVRRRTDQPPLTHIIRTTRRKFFGHIARADPSMDHSRLLRSSVAPNGWDHRSGRPRQTWLRTIESDVAPLNVGLATVYYRAQNRQAWRSLVETATSTGQAA